MLGIPTTISRQWLAGHTSLGILLNGLFQHLLHRGQKGGQSLAAAAIHCQGSFALRLKGSNPALGGRRVCHIAFIQQHDPGLAPHQGV